MEIRCALPAYMALVRILLPGALLIILACDTTSVTITSFILRNRVVVNDHVVMKKALYVAFAVAGKTNGVNKILVTGQVLHNNEKIAQAITSLFQERNGNLVFDLPYELPEGKYSILINAVGDTGKFRGHGSVTVNRDDLRQYAGVASVPTAGQLYELIVPSETPEIKPTEREKAAGYVIYRRSSSNYAAAGSKPKARDIINTVSINTVRNKFETINFTLYPLRNLGKTKIKVDDLVGDSGRVLQKNIKIGVLESVPETIGLPSGYYRNLPVLIKNVNEVNLAEGASREILLKIKIDRTIRQGVYKGNITIMPQRGEVGVLPIRMSVEPIDLEEIPGKDYFMLMTYEFTELAMPGSLKEKKDIYLSASNILQDYKDHGMTTLAIHSPFVYMTQEDGTPILDDIFAALIAARDLGFKKPIIWYMGHLIQTAKTKHPGNIADFHEEIQVARLRHLIKIVSEYAEKNQCPPVIFLPIDEPDDATQDFHGIRQKETPILLRSIHDSGAKTMLTVQKYDRFPPIDYICSSDVHTQDIDKAHQQGSVFWGYNNNVTTQCENPAYARYIYGYYTWKNNLDGMTSWTFQNTQNANGVPLEIGSPTRDVFLAYPDPSAPISTLRWEAIRDGIDDHKLIYQLMKRITILKDRGMDTSRYENFIISLKKNRNTPACHINEQSPWGSDYFEKTGKELKTMILDADKQYTAQIHTIH